MRISIRNVFAWAFSLLLAYGYVVDAGLPKLVGSAGYVAVFGQFGYPLWFMYLIGAWETVSGLLLLLPSLAFYGAVALGIEMIGAATTHFVTGVGSPFHALRGLALLAILAWLRWPRRRRGTSPEVLE